MDAACFGCMQTQKRKDTHTYIFSFGGERGIRTLERVLAVTRFPIVRLRPAQPSLHISSILPSHR